MGSFGELAAVAAAKRREGFSRIYANPAVELSVCYTVEDLKRRVALSLFGGAH